MKVKITPSTTQGTVRIPASKSMAHRAIICASLAQGTSLVSNITYSKDIEATISCMEKLGAKIEKHEDSCTVIGTDIRLPSGNIECDCSESGSTLRFLIPIAAMSNAHVTMIGHGRLMKRPMEVYENIFKEQGLLFEQTDTIQIQGPLKSQDFEIRGDISSQFITGLMFVLPLLEQDSTLHILPPFESKSYVALTIQMLSRFGIKIEEVDDFTYRIPGQQTYQPNNVSVEGDYSQMAFFAVLAALQSSLTCENMDPNSKQGDKAILDFVQNAGATVNENTIVHNELHAQTMDVANCPDLGPILCVLASYSKGTTQIINAKRLRMKESDRIEAMEQELKKWNVDISSTEDTITITGKDEYQSDSIVEIHGHNDHRIVMAMTVFGLCAKSECIIDDAQAITKSYPVFFEDIQSIGGKVEEV